MNAPKKRSPFAIVRRLIVLVRPMLPVMLAAIAMGVAGYFCATFITIFGGFGLLAAGHRRAVFDEYDLEALVGLFPEAGKQLGDLVGPVVHRHYDGKESFLHN